MMQSFDFTGDLRLNQLKEVLVENKYFQAKSLGQYTKSAYNLID